MASKRQKASSDGLETYRAKRSADRTTEPFSLGGDGTAPAVGTPGMFVCQQHAARRMHWDLRLEIGGVLRSWAVPRGPSACPADKRLAVQTEDHPLEYVDFEGVIPAGNYGAGSMIVWDRGVWLPLEPVAEGFEKGKLLFELRGQKLRGVWTLVRTKEADGRHWLLIKKPDAAAVDEPDPPLEPHSILSGLTVQELGAGVDRLAAARDRLERAGVPRGDPNLAEVSVMLAEPRSGAFSAPGWFYELKYDGYRVLACRRGDDVQLRYRSGRLATETFPEIVRALRSLPANSAILDTEVVVLDDDARPNFQRLQKRALLTRRRDIDRATREHPVHLYAFDLLALEGHDLRDLPLSERKTYLRDLLPQTGLIRFTDHIEAQGEALMLEVRKLGLEGIVAKDAQSRYTGGRSSAWQKIRIEHTEDFVVVGFSRPEGNRTGFKALHLASYTDHTLTYAGRVGTGFTERDLVSLRTELEGFATDVRPFEGAPPPGDHVWVEPKMVVEIRYKHRTDDGLLRHPVFVRRRVDKSPSECRDPELEEPPPQPEAPPEEPDTQEPDTEASRPDSRSSSTSSRERRVVISNPDKVFWPDDGYTKRDLIDYYRSVSGWILPYLRDRPVVLTRYPDGIAGKSFFQKNAPPYVPEWLRTQTIWSEHAQREIEYFLCDDVQGLTYLANLATIPLHVWGSRMVDLQHPDWCILDLDPKSAPFSDVVRIAQEIGELCDQIGLPAFPKTSGSTGLHVLIPTGGHFTFEQTRQLAEILARVVSDRLRDIATVERSMRARKGRVYIDYVQNGHGRLLVAPLCVRPLPGAPVSTPLRWDEVTRELDHQSFTIRTVPPRLEARGDPMVDLLHRSPDLEAALARLLERMNG